MIFRLYRRQRPRSTTLSPADDSFLGDVRRGIRAARDVVASVQTALGPSTGPLVGRTLIREYRFVMMLQRLEATPEVRSQFTYTHGGYFLDMPFANAKGVTHFRLVGHTHWTPVLVNGIPVDGDAALKDLAELIDEYFYPSNGAPPADHELYWLNYHAPISAEDPFGEFEWLIHPPKQGLRTQISHQKPFLRFFQFEFMGLESNRDRAKAEDGLLERLLGTSFLRHLLDKVGLGALADGLEAVFGTLAEVQAFLNDVSAVVVTVTDYITGVQQFIRTSIATVRGLITSVEGIIGQIENAIEQARLIPTLVGDELDRMVESLKNSAPGLMRGDTTGAVLTVEKARRLRDLLLALAAQPSAFVPVVSGAPQPTLAIAYRLTEGLSLERIAQTTSVDVQTLIRANGLRFPFVDPRPRPDRQLAAATVAYAAAQAARDRALTDGSTPAQIAAALSAVNAANLEVHRWQAVQESNPAEPGVLYAGDLIRIPQQGTGPIPSIFGIDGHRLLPDGSPPTEEERLFGIDLQVTDAGDLVWDDTARDLVLVHGLDNIVQAQRRYLRLPLNELRFAPGLGNYAYEYLTNWEGPGRNRLLAYSIFRTLEQDPRIRRVRHVRAQSYAGVAHVRYEADLINGEQLPDLRQPLMAHAA